MAKSKIPTLKSFVTLAINKRKKYIIVEEIDDIKFYENIAISISLENFKVKFIGHLVDYPRLGNCDKVIEYMKKISSLPINEDKKKFILGIIDGDAKKYKNSISNRNDLLYILQYYSWESYFVNKEVVAKTVIKFLKTRTLIDDKLITIIYKEILEYLLDTVWFCGLKKLKYELQKKKEDSLCNKKEKLYKELLKQLEMEKDELKKFAVENNLKQNEEIFLEITLGKLSLNSFIEIYLKILKRLPNLCKKNEITKCDYCKYEENNNCLYNLKNENLRESDIKVFITELDDIQSLTPIKQRISQLK